MRHLIFSIVIFFFFAVAATDNANAAKNGWSPVIIATGEYKQKIESTPIELRPNRPFHIYGNTLRRRYYRNIKSHGSKTVSSNQRTNTRSSR
ncbi:hypothetical protein OAE79_00140 [Rhodopirellula sp.]|nr:hypothetical protein [Rhodopirellula sp.]MDB4331633.1 hypothetical protein [bacterium]MDB4678721.1 hypothetical protein [Rhodopirellula sp.]